MKQVADTLSADKVLISSAYTVQHHPRACRNNDFHDPYRWNSTTLGYILDRQEYLGHTVLGKSISENFKSKKRRKATPDELRIFPNTHEAIVDEEIWNTAQRLKTRKKKKLVNGTYSHRLSGLIYCADCGSRLSYRSPKSQNRPDGKTYDVDNAFVCSSYRQMYRDCTMHYIKASVVEQLLLQSVQSMAAYVSANEKKFTEQILEHWNLQKDKVAELTDTMLNEFIEKVVVHEVTGGRTAQRSQQIDIYFNFIGQFTPPVLPEEPMSEAELQALKDEEARKDRERKDRRNATVRKYKQKKKEEQAKKITGGYSMVLIKLFFKLLALSVIVIMTLVQWIVYDRLLCGTVQSGSWPIFHVCPCKSGNRHCNRDRSVTDVGIEFRNLYHSIHSGMVYRENSSYSVRIAGFY